ncbi:serpin family protein [Alkalicoccobacillus gibsonii]|uniref:serpin family protein n=1 Tax=Alkalicoccobacillus gibsonii TaxID=79881 RepID=UPI00193387A0|nr:serpin family protein [Alkalicoccobacillus gibsonii]MBM0064068.1 serpin family protein [Alkalicoccobacillus gibsonii]
MSRVLPFGIGVMVVLLSGCGGSSQNDDPTSPAASPPRDSVNIDSEISSAHFATSDAFFKAIIQEHSDQNVLISPYSLQVLLYMLANGLGDSNREELLEALHVNAIDLEALNQSVQQTIQSFDDLPFSDVKTANSIWHRDHLAVEEDFKEMIGTYYNGEAHELRELNPAEELNDWVHEKTNGLIEKLVEEVPSNVIAYLINAVYLDADWEKPFEKHLTIPGSFYLLDGEDIQHPMMKQTETFQYMEESSFEAVKLPYQDEGLSMIVVLPDTGAYEEVAFDLDFSMFVNGDWSRTEMDLQLPAFTFKSEYDLEDRLTEMGMGVLFNQGLDTSTLFGEGSTHEIDEVLQKTYINVDEEGTEAAAVTGAALNESATLVEKRFIVDRPFLFSIIDEETETILFMGSVVRPVIEP